MSDQEREVPIVARDEKGELRDLVTGARIIVFSCSAYRSMCDELFEQFQSGASVILYRMGEGYARKVSAAFPKLGLSPEDVMQGMKRLGYLAGWGKFQFDLSDPESIDCTVENSAFVLKRSGASETTCYFLSGILGTIGSEVYKRKYVAREISCVASGEPLCRFKVSADLR